MNWKKRITSLLLAGGLVAGMFPAITSAVDVDGATKSGQSAGIPFTDVKQGAWYYDAVEYVYQNGLMAGTSPTTFGPESTLTRAMVVQILHNKENKPSYTGSTSFEDVPENRWYYDAVQWAVSNNVTAGVGGGKFNPEGRVSREQFAQFLYNYQGKPEVHGSLDFPDTGDISGWAVSAMTWANQNKLINGSKQSNGQVLLLPQAFTTRAQAASILRGFCQMGNSQMGDNICGDNLTWTLDSAGTLTISGTGQMYDWLYEAPPWNAFREQIKKIVIEDGVTSISYSAFYDCSSVTSVTIPDSVTSIGDFSFSHCSSLTGVTIPDNVTNIGDGMFEFCSSLTSMTIPDSVASIGSGAFYDCPSLKSVIIGNGVKSIGNGAFYDCSSLTSVTMGNSVVSIEKEAFRDCSRLTNITIPDSVTSIGEGAFWQCDSLPGMTIPDSVTTIGDSAFQGCSGLTSVTIGNGVTSIGGDAFSCCDGLTGFTIDSNNPAYSSANGVLFNKNKTELVVYPGGKTGEYTIPSSVTRIGDSAFVYCRGLTNVTIPDSVTSIGDYAFQLCDSLPSVTIPEGVTRIGEGTFMDCSGLTRVTIPSSVTGIGYGAFAECDRLANVYYTGSEAQWSAISIDGENEPLTSAVIHYNS